MTTNARPAPAWDEDAVRARASNIFREFLDYITSGDLDDEISKAVAAILAVVREHLPVSGESRAAVQAEALHDAADEYEARLPDGTGNGRAYNSYTVAAMLRARADRLAAEGGADRG